MLPQLDMSSHAAELYFVLPYLSYFHISPYLPIKRWMYSQPIDLWQMAFPISHVGFRMPAISWQQHSNGVITFQHLEFSKLER